MKAVDIKRFVLDASVAVAWCFPEETTAGLESLLEQLATTSTAIVPAIWPFEVASALLIGEKRKRTTAAQVTLMLQRIARLPVAIEGAQVHLAFEAVLSVARHQQLTEYDAAYFELALREGLPLATLDKRLRDAALNAGLTLIEL